ncbi:response regulator [Neptunomonas antarctica]|uniref:Response regulator receiver domain-containing protein n=1 Tax=Neptunomonas antarctica TaxID=619304 RepID=A0A1N7IV12_9GAMM|nr:response regulator [Neptunomonas antarctica]SIS40935.1 Response regulator receiver domain-containing protein [Neptunomonas antarctica]
MHKQPSEVTLFLIEDDDVDAMSISRAFNKLRIGNPIVRAKDGLEALEMLQQGDIKKPFIILLDLQMPRMNGLEFIEAVRKEPDFEDSIIFVLTTSRSEDEMMQAYHQQIAGYFLKESSGEGILDVVAVLNGYWKIAYLPT